MKPPFKYCRVCGEAMPSGELLPMRCEDCRHRPSAHLLDIERQLDLTDESIRQLHKRREHLVRQSDSLRYYIERMRGNSQAIQGGWDMQTEARKKSGWDMSTEAREPSANTLWEEYRGMKVEQIGTLQYRVKVPNRDQWIVALKRAQTWSTFPAQHPWEATLYYEDSTGNNVSTMTVPPTLLKGDCIQAALYLLFQYYEKNGGYYGHTEESKRDDGLRD